MALGSIALLCESAVPGRARTPSCAFAALRRHFHPCTALYLNRFLFDPSADNFDYTRPSSSNRRIPTVTLPKEDYRTIHAAKILSLQNGDKLRAGIVSEKGTNSSTDFRVYAGYITDEASVEWLPEGKIKKAQPTKNGDPPGSLRITLDSLASSLDDDALSDVSTDDKSDAKSMHSNDKSQESQSVSLILALPRPLQLGRILPMISQMGVDHLVLTAAKKVPKDYFGSHLFRRPEELRRLLIEGLCQCGDVRIPQVTIAKRLRPFLEDELDVLFPPHEVARVIAHPQRVGQIDPPIRMREITFPNTDATANPRIVVAVGPEGGWEEPYELDMFERLGFQQITMGTRVLRSDVAVVSLLSLAHDVCNEKKIHVVTHPFI